MILYNEELFTKFCKDFYILLPLLCPLTCVLSTLLIAFLGPKISDLSSESHIARKNKEIGLISCLINCLEAIKESIERE